LHVVCSSISMSLGAQGGLSSPPGLVSGDEASVGYLGGEQSPWKDRLCCTGNGCDTVRTRQWSNTLKMAVVARDCEPSRASLTSVSGARFAFAALAAVPSSRFGLPRRVALPGVVASATARLPRFGVAGSGILILAARLPPRRPTNFSFDGLPSVEAYASSDVWGPALSRASLRRNTRDVSLGRRRCFGSGAMRGTLLRQGVVAGDVEVRSLLRTRASPSQLFPRSGACTASSRPRSRLWPLWSVCEGGACCSVRAFVCVSARPRSVQQRWFRRCRLRSSSLPRCLVHRFSLRRV
jgi:hypothetical protein